MRWVGLCVVLAASCMAEFPASLLRRAGPPPTAAPTYYIAASGGSDANPGDTPAAPWASFAHAWTQLVPGDVLVLLDGTYGPMDVEVSGEPGNAITIRAANDGKAILDGGGVTETCELKGSEEAPLSDLVLEGLVCRNGGPVGEESIAITRAERLTFRRVSAEGTQSDGTVVQAYLAADILFEDLAVYGTGHTLIGLPATERITLRRCYAHWTGSAVTDNDALSLSGSRGSQVENCVLVGQGLHVSSPDYYQPPDDVSVRGVLVHEAVGWALILNGHGRIVTGNRVEDLVAVNTDLGVFVRTGIDTVIDRTTIAGRGTGTGFSANPDSTSPPTDAAFEVQFDFTNSVLTNLETGMGVNGSALITRKDHAFNAYWNVTTPHSGVSAGANDLFVDPGFDVKTYGKGGYLLGALALPTAGSTGGRVGAQILYRTVDGVLTSEPLWPWPMEERVLSETGRSVTWEAAGGVWLTLAGVYP